MPHVIEVIRKDDGSAVVVGKAQPGDASVFIDLEKVCMLSQRKSSANVREVKLYFVGGSRAAFVGEEAEAVLEAYRRYAHLP